MCKVAAFLNEMMIMNHAQQRWPPSVSGRAVRCRRGTTTNSNTGYNDYLHHQCCPKKYNEHIFRTMRDLDIPKNIMMRALKGLQAQWIVLLSDWFTHGYRQSDPLRMSRCRNDHETGCTALPSLPTPYHPYQRKTAPECKRCFVFTERTSSNLLSSSS